jgi:hypothetical protein
MKEAVPSEQAWKPSAKGELAHVHLVSASVRQVALKQRKNRPLAIHSGKVEASPDEFATDRKAGAAATADINHCSSIWNHRGEAVEPRTLNQFVAS